MRTEACRLALDAPPTSSLLQLDAVRDIRQRQAGDWIPGTSMYSLVEERMLDRDVFAVRRWHAHAMSLATGALEDSLVMAN
mmetsp:Transcript_44422/g.129167  ORF Transcript_44422/g.129167 Transcript_44422/m.129167 type:complete len:81 (+) Transcript_44422:241-483(+)